MNGRLVARRGRAVLVLTLVIVLGARPIRGQTPASPPQPTLTTTIAADTLRDLPTADNPFSILETTQGEVTSDRFYGGGLNTGRPARIGAFLNSWIQTQFRIDDVNVTRADGSGAPFVFPIVTPWDRVDISSGLMPPDINAPGLAVTLVPRRPAASWQHIVEGSGAGGSMIAGVAPTVPPAIQRVDSWAHGSVLVSGPATDRLGVVLAATYNRASQVSRSAGTVHTGDVGSAFTHLVFTPREGEEVRTLGMVEHTRAPPATATGLQQPLASEGNTATHVQSTWERRLASGSSWRVFGGYSFRNTSPDALTNAVVSIERLTDGPVPNLVDTGAHRDHQWSIGSRGVLAAGPLGGSRQSLTAGIDLGRSISTIAPGFGGTIRELINGTSARLWRYSAIGVDSKRYETTLDSFVAYHVNVAGRVTFDAAARYDGVSGGADGAASTISWHSVLPRASVRWTVARAGEISLFGGAGMSADHLTLDLLAWGDPAAPVATVADTAGTGLPFARVGPGTAGDPSFSAIDPSLARPTTDEVVVGVEAHPVPSMRLRFAGVAKRERNLIGVINSGVPSSSYAVATVVDSIADPAHPQATQLLPVYNRLPASFGRDQYVLTNPSTDAATFGGLVFSADFTSARAMVLFGATASQTDGPASNRGFHADENDIGAPGEAFSNPNAAIFTNGRLFLDRAYTAKLTAIGRFAHDVRLGVIARYQDGQPFSRLVVVPNLNQGAEFIRAYPAGDTRFTYVGTLDVRLQKGFRVAGGELDGFVDAFNVINLGNEVEEQVVTGPGFRTITAVQPPRAIHIGLRVSF